MKGIVTAFFEDRGYGFIKGEDETEIFVHYSDIKMRGFKNLHKGEKVSYEIENTEKGNKAVEVRRLET